MIKTTKGDIDEATLARTLGFEDRPTDLVIWVEWRLENRREAEVIRREAYLLPKESGPLVSTSVGVVPFAELARTIELVDNQNEISVAVVWRQADHLVRRDAHVILKQASVVASALAASLG